MNFNYDIDRISCNMKAHAISFSTRDHGTDSVCSNLVSRTDTISRKLGNTDA